MADQRVSRMDSPTCGYLVVGIALALLLALLVCHPPVRAQFGSCSPGTICRGQGGGGGGGTPATPPATPPPPVTIPGGPGSGGGDGGDSGGGDGGGGGSSGGGGGGGPAPTPNPWYQHNTNFWCVPDPTGAGLCPELMNLTMYCGQGGCYVVDYACKTYEQCQRATEPTPPVTEQPPCEPGFNGGGVYLQCDGDDGNSFDWGYYLRVWAEVPGHSAQIRPFPRWLVNEPGMLCLSRSPAFSQSGGSEGPGDAAGFWSHKVNLPADKNWDVDEPGLGDIKDYHIGIRWRMLNPGESLFGGPSVPQSCWYFDEREWSENAPVACGDCVAHVYDTSSYGLPENGPTWVPANEGCAKVPSESGQWTNPAYQVAVPTYWVAEWADEWYQWEQVGWEAGGCFYTDAPAPGTQGCSSGEHAGESGWYQTQGDPVYDWVQHFIGWEPIDLREVGASSDGLWYYTSWAVRTTGSGTWCSAEYADPNPGATVRVPVIEVQAVTVANCRVTGDCGDLNPPDAGDLLEPPTPPTPVPTPPPGDGGGGGDCPFCPPCP